MAGVCRICKHPEREAIEMALIARTPLRAIEAKFGVSKTALVRHASDHFAAGLAKAHDAEDMARGDRLLKKMSQIADKAEAILVAHEATAKDKGSPEIALKAIRELRECIRLLAELEGKLHTNPIINFVGSPEWTALRTAIIAALDPYPDAKLAMVKCLGDDLANMTPHGSA